MAYRKTEKVLAELENRRTLIVEAAIHILHTHGMEAVTCDKVALRARMSVGVIYTRFPDMNELRAFVLAQLLDRHLDLLRTAGSIENGIRAWAKLLASSPHTASALAADAGYREGIKRELAKQIRATGAESPNTMAAVACGAVIETARSSLALQAATLTSAVLRAIGVRSKARASA